MRAFCLKRLPFHVLCLTALLFDIQYLVPLVNLGRVFYGIVSVGLALVDLARISDQNFVITPFVFSVAHIELLFEIHFCHI